MKQKVIVAGAGIAGLTAGIYAQSSGFDVTILEQGNAPGGNCTGWYRKGYYIEGALHWLIGAGANESANKLWYEVGVLNDRIKTISPEVVATVLSGEAPVYLFGDPKKTRDHLLTVSPQDAKAIETLYKDVCKFMKMSMPVSDVKGVRTTVKEKGFGIRSILKMAGCFTRMPALTKMDIREYAGQFQNKEIRAALAGVVNASDYSSLGMISTLASYARKDGLYLEGGSNAMIERMTARYQTLGGELLLNSPVEKVIIEDGYAKGVIMNGKRLDADAVIIAADAASAVDKLLPSPPADEWVSKMRTLRLTVCSFVALGLKKELKGLSKSLSFRLEKPLEHMGARIEVLNLWQYGDFPYAPEGHTAMSLAIMGDTYQAWRKAKEEGRYKEEKERLAAMVINAIEEANPEWAGCVEVLDVATPLTYERYCKTFHGSWMSYMETSSFGYPGTISNASNVFFAGQRLMPPGGMPVALTTGRNAAQRVCILLDKEFTVPAINI